MSDYNGYTNYETWAVALWMDNEQSTQEHAMAMAREAIEGAPYLTQTLSGIWSDDSGARFTLADGLKDWHESNRPELDGIWNDLLGAAFESVDWNDIAKTLIGTIREESDA